TFDITSTSTVQDLLNFMQAATGIQTAIDDPLNPIPGSVDNIPGESGTLAPGVSLNNGQIRVVSNNGVDNAISLSLSSFKETTTTGEDISVGTGLVRFDGQGNLLNTTNSTVNIERRNIPSSDPLSFNLDFSQVSGLSVATSSLSVARQDGSPAGTLSSFIIGEDGT